MSYFSNYSPQITENPRKTNAKNIERFIQEVCCVYLGADTETEVLFDKYKKWCIYNNLEYTNSFNVFSRSFRYYAYHQAMLNGIVLHRVNYTAYKEGIGYINKNGWAYYNLTCRI